MLLPTRAGLVILVITLLAFFTVANAAPVANRDTGLSYGNRYSALVTHSTGTDSLLHSEKDTRVRGAQILSGCLNGSMETLERRGLRAALKHAFEKVAHGIEHVVHKVADGVKTAVHAVAHVATTVAKKVESGVTTAAKKVWHFTKTVGAAAVKFGMKLYATGEKLAAKVAGFFPEFGGKALEKAMDLHAKVINTISDKIHAKEPARLQKGINVLGKINKYSSYAPI